MPPLDLSMTVPQMSHAFDYHLPYVQSLGINYCVPENPVYKTLKLKAQINLFKLRNCMNIAGMKREVDAFAAPTDLYSGLPSIGENGQMNLPGIQRFSPTQYRYEYIMERAKQLVALAQQVEANFLAALEKRDAEAYSLMKAKQDLGLAKATVKLQDLRIKVAEGEVKLAQLSKERSELQVEGLEEMIAQGILQIEQDMIALYQELALIASDIAYLNANISTTSSMISIAANTVAGMTVSAGLGVAIAGAALKAISEYSRAGLVSQQATVQSELSTLGLQASQARREQEWNFQKTLAEKDVQIGRQQVKVAQDRVRVAGQEKVISQLQVDFAEDTVTFLKTKFTNVELYSWMSNIMENVYAFFLQQATGTAKLAVQQLAFERQQAPPPYIQDDYWEYPTAGTIQIQPAGTESDRRGLTGSVRLLQDIYKVDQYAFETDKRKIQLSKTFSLATLFPIEFQQFKETGELTFETLMEYFDRDYPGLYLRTIKQVNINVIALANPVDGIKATLTSSGISRVVVKGDTFQEQLINRTPEVITLSAKSQNNGVYAMQADQKFLNPFEGSGVHSRWLFSMPKSSNFINYDAVADVLMTIEYTAFYDRDYQQQLLRRMDPSLSSDRAFVFSQELADQFYELNNPEESATPMEVSFNISRFDFPANLSEMRIEHLKLLYVVDQEKVLSSSFDHTNLETEITFTSSATTIKGTGTPNEDGLLGTPFGNLGSLVSIIGQEVEGTFTIKLTKATGAIVNNQLNFENDVVANYFRDGIIKDVILVVTYNGDLQLALYP